MDITEMSYLGQNKSDVLPATLPRHSTITC